MEFDLVASELEHASDCYKRRNIKTPASKVIQGSFFLLATIESNSHYKVIHITQDSKTVIDQSKIRDRIQKERAQLSRNQQAVSSQKICHEILNSGALIDAENIAIYLPVRGEADPSYLRELDKLSKKSFYLPILSQENKNHLEFALYNEHTQMKHNRFNIPEPDVAAKDLLTNPRKLDAVIMPMVAIDRLGNRIGMGGGFYDRTFEFRKTEKCKPILIAFAYDFQLIDEQTPQAWDVPTDLISLESEFITL